MTMDKERLNETMLIKAARDNPAEFEKLYQRWVAPLYRYIYARVGNSADAEDLTSQVILAAYQGLPGYQHRDNFAGWLFTIARNQTWRWITRRQREQPLDYEPVPITHPDLLADISKLQEIQRLRKLVFALPEDEKELIYLRYVAGLKFSEMSVVLKRSEDAVKKSIYRLQDRLRTLLEDSND